MKFQTSCLRERSQYLGHAAAGWVNTRWKAVMTFRSDLLFGLFPPRFPSFGRRLVRSGVDQNYARGAFRLRQRNAGRRRWPQGGWCGEKQ